MNRSENCSTCRWCERNELKDMICVNSDSEYVADYVDETHWCTAHTEYYG